MINLLFLLIKQLFLPLTRSRKGRGVIPVVLIALLTACADQTHPAAITDFTQPTVVNTQPADPIDLQSKNHVYFKINSTQLDGKSLNILNAHADYLTAHPDIQVSLMSYTDGVGQAGYNKKLAKHRAEVVANELEADGVNMSRIHIIYADILPENLAISPDQDRRVDLLYDTK